MTTAPDATTALFDPASGRLRLSPDHLGLLAHLGAGQQPPTSLRDALARAGILDADGQLATPLRPVAAAAAGARAVIRVSRLRGDTLREVQVRTGGDGTLVGPVGDPGEVGEVALQPPWSLARTLWRLCHLGVRPHEGVPGTELDPEELLRGVRAGGGPWWDTLGVRDAVLNRLELRVQPEETAASLVLLDAPEGCWTVASGDGGVRLRPIRGTTVLDILAAWQRDVLGVEGRATADEPGASVRAVDVGGVRVHVPVPEGWEELDPAPALPLLAREARADGFAVNVTVADGPPVDADPVAAARALASTLDEGRPVDAWPSPGGGTAVVLHAGPRHDVVAVQRHIDAGDRALAVTYSCAVGQWPSRGSALCDLAAAVEATTADEGRAT